MPSMQDTLAGAGTGAGAAWLRKHDIDKGHTTLSKQWGTWGEFGAAALPYVTNMVRIGIPPRIAESVGIAGAALLAERLVRSTLSTGGFGTGSPLYAARNPAAGAWSAPYARPFTQKEPSLTLI